MTKTVLITRARGDETELTDALHEHGLNVVHEPLTEILLIHTARQKLEQALACHPNAVLVTSRHGVRALAALTPLRDLAILCVGEATLQVALSLGFTRAVATGQSADAMIEYVLSAYDDDARFVYPSAEHISTDLTAVLAQHGMETARVVVYEAKAIDKLSDTIIEHIKKGHINAVAFMSQRNASIFMELIAQVKLNKQLKKMTACCMSKAIAEILNKSAWRALHSANEPTLASLALCVDNAMR